MFQVSDAYIEISGVCNARCPYCVKGSGAQKQGGFMPTDTFDKVLGHLKANQILPKSRCVNIYNWGEPLLHPQINEILKIVGEYGLKAYISTNLIFLPLFTKEALSNLKGLTISLSGFTQKSYRYIYGKQLESVLKNVDRLLQMLKDAGCRWRPTVNWHRYRFNEIELATAKSYFSQRGIPFYPTVAHLNDMKRTEDYFFGNSLSTQEKGKIANDLFTEYLKNCYLKNSDIDYYCPQWSMLSIDENANLLVCCGLSNEVEGMVLGSIFDYNAANIEKVKKPFSFCYKCLEHGLSKWAHNQGSSNLLVSGLAIARNVLNRLGLTRYIPEKGIKMVLSLAANLIIKRQIALLKK
jgi:MoaA/NifB/PqqE/SkfB family radical SAM enzyme